MAGRSTSPVRGWVLGLFLLIAAFSHKFTCSSLPENENHSEHSDRTAAVTNQGVQGTVSGGSSRNPLINDLVTVQDLAEMQTDLKQLNRLLKELGMTFYLEQSRDMTMFMPVDSAFAQLPFNIHELSWQAKWRIMQYHIIPNDVIDLDNALKGKKETEFQSWEGAPIKLAKVTPEDSGEGASSGEYKVNDEAIIISKPPKIETFNGASYKINKVMLPPSMTEEDLKPAKLEQRINPEVSQRLRRRPSSEGTPSVEQEQQLASVDGTVQMERSARDPRLPGSFRPDPLAQRSQVTPDFVRGVNNQHARWDDAVYHRLPRSDVRDERRPQDEIMGFQQESSEHEDTQARIKVLGRAEGSVLPTNGDQPAITRISGSGSRPSSIGLTFESSENPDAAPSDPVGHFMDVLLGGRSVSNPATQEAASAPSESAAGSASQGAASTDHSQKAEPSLFSMEMTPTEGPRVKALGLTEGLLPAEELITHHWSASKQHPVKQGKENRRAEEHPPLVALWQRITRNNP